MAVISWMTSMVSVYSALTIVAFTNRTNIVSVRFCVVLFTSILTKTTSDEDREWYFVGVPG